MRSACDYPPPPAGSSRAGSSTSLGLAGVLVEVVAHPLDLARLVDARPRQARLVRVGVGVRVRVRVTVRVRVRARARARARASARAKVRVRVP